MNVGFWNAQRDEELKSLLALGYSASQIAAELGTTRNAVIGRSHRIKGTRFPTEERRRLEKREATARVKAEVRSLEDASIQVMLGRLTQDIERDRAISLAVDDGATMRAIADALGVSRQRIQQIVARYRSRAAA